MVYLGNTNQYFSYSEIDDVKENCALEIFALKNGLPLDNNDVKVQEFTKMQEMKK